MNKARRVIRDVVRPIPLLEGAPKNQVKKYLKTLGKYWEKMRESREAVTEETTIDHRVTAIRAAYACDPTIDQELPDFAGRSKEDFQGYENAVVSMMSSHGEGMYMAWILRTNTKVLSAAIQLKWLLDNRHDVEDYEEQSRKAKAIIGLTSEKRVYAGNQIVNRGAAVMHFAQSGDYVEFFTEALEAYHALKTSAAAEQVPDLMTFQTWGELHDWLADAGVALSTQTIPPLELDGSEISALESWGGTVLFPDSEQLKKAAAYLGKSNPEAYGSPKYVAVRVETYDGAAAHGRGSAWCTRHGEDSEYIDEYFHDRMTPLYSVYAAEEAAQHLPISANSTVPDGAPVVRIAQFHFDNGDIGEEDDISINNLENSPIPGTVLADTGLDVFLAAVAEMEKDFNWTPPEKPDRLDASWRELFDRYDLEVDDDGDVKLFGLDEYSDLLLYELNKRALTDKYRGDIIEVGESVYIQGVARLDPMDFDFDAHLEPAIRGMPLDEEEYTSEFAELFSLAVVEHGKDAQREFDTDHYGSQSTLELHVGDSYKGVSTEELVDIISDGNYIAEYVVHEMESDFLDHFEIEYADPSCYAIRGEINIDPGETLENIDWEDLLSDYAGIK